LTTKILIEELAIKNKQLIEIYKILLKQKQKPLKTLFSKHRDAV